MKYQGVACALALSMGLCAASPARAVTVDIDIETEGEPVPGASISFRTPDGEDVPVIQLTVIADEDGPEPEIAKDSPAGTRTG